MRYVIYEAATQFKEEIVKEGKTFSVSFDDSDVIAYEKILAIVVKCVLVIHVKHKTINSANYSDWNVILLHKAPLTLSVTNF